MLTRGEKRPGGKWVVALLLSAATLDITRCSLVLLTYRHLTPAIWFVATGAAMAVLSVAAARGYRAGRRWAAVVALLIGLASAPQASGSGFRPPFTIPDVATATLGIALAVAILAFIGSGTPQPMTMSPSAKSSAARRPQGRPQVFATKGETESVSAPPARAGAKAESSGPPRRLRRNTRCRSNG